jgi:ABC-type transporter Mla subunit MlaD
MNRPFRLRYVNQLVGSFVLLIVLLILAGLLLVSQQRELFESQFVLRSLVPEHRLGGLREGTDVLMLGQRVGEVKTIRYLTDEEIQKLGPDAQLDGQPLNVLVELRINMNVKDQIFTDSVAHIHRKLAGAGDAYIEIVRGRAVPRTLLEEGDQIKLIPGSEPGQELAEIRDSVLTVRDAFVSVRNSMVPAFEQFGDASERFGEASDSLNDTNQRIQSVVDDVQDVTPRLDEFTRSAQELVDSSQEVVDTLQSETDQLPGTVRDVRKTVNGAQEVVEGLRQHWLLRRYVDQGDDRPIRSSEVGRGGHW